MIKDRLWKNFWETISYKDTSDRAVKQDILLKTITCIILAFVAGILTILNINKHFSFMTVTTTILSLGMVVAAVLCGKFKRTDIATALVAVLGIIILTDYAVSGQNEGFAILWITMVPLICMLWMGFKIGFAVSLYFQIMLIVIFYTGVRDSMGAHYTDIFMTRFPILYFGTFFVSTWIFYQKQKSQMLSDRAGRMDALTQVDNRLGYDLKLSAVFNKKTVSDLHVLVFDINRLKYINDEFGHKAGDEIIVAACNAIMEAFPDYNVFARVGGDEFCLLSTKKDLNFQEGKETLKNITSKWKGQYAPFLSISCGHAYGQEVTEEAYRNLLYEADQKMYEDKSKFYQENAIDRRRR